MNPPKYILEEYLNGIIQSEQHAKKCKNYKDLIGIRIYKKQYQTAIRILKLIEEKTNLKQ